MTLTDRRFRRHLRAARRGEPPALRWLWDTYAGPVTGFLLARGTPDVDEVVNDVFLAAFHGLFRFSGEEVDFRAWLFTIARNKRADALRRQARRLPTAPLAGAEPAAVPGAEEAALAAIDDTELLSLLESLTEDQRDVIVLRFIADLSLAQTAAVLDKPVGAVKATQHRALAQLRKKFPADPYPP